MNGGAKNRGCFYYGCLTAVLVLIGVVVGTFLGTRYAVKKVVADYTDSAPAPVPSVNVSEGEAWSRAERLAREFASASTNGSTVTLDSTDVNLLLRADPALKPYAGRIHIGIETNDVMKATVSLPLDSFEVWRKASSRLMSDDLRNRYLNADVLMVPVVTNSQLQFALKDVQVRGASLPGEFTGKLQLNEIMQSANTNPDVRNVLDKIETLELRNGKLEVRFKGR